MHISIIFYIFASKLKIKNVIITFSRKIGETFAWNKGNTEEQDWIKLAVKEVKTPTCKGCYFHDENLIGENNPYGCKKIYGIVGDCDENGRTDKKNVIFQEVV